ncbi:MAG: hypothetical protein KDH94_01555 [Coxiellaceae bacterium]|nr:hypothetical protein [Coxiellaceae bacterium]
MTRPNKGYGTFRTAVSESDAVELEDLANKAEILKRRGEIQSLRSLAKSMASSLEDIEKSLKALKQTKEQGIERREAQIQIYLKEQQSSAQRLTEIVERIQVLREEIRALTSPQNGSIAPGC